VTETKRQSEGREVYEAMMAAGVCSGHRRTVATPSQSVPRSLYGRRRSV